MQVKKLYDILLQLEKDNTQIIYLKWGCLIAKFTDFSLRIERHRSSTPFGTTSEYSIVFQYSEDGDVIKFHKEIPELWSSQIIQELRQIKLDIFFNN